ncbi:hypothetical protein EDD69_10284 [Thermolongibacillus altinsuensis]|uniref:Uncharacterized protein n=1 Tax=Thermolongibacillus altinsuensis TaxID=575256 RepID=A0A4R1QGM7_9BACL|nr:hypothetical protein EDD69_10284 [Thermolongibacillus altinsuensis]
MYEICGEKKVRGDGAMNSSKSLVASVVAMFLAIGVGTIGFMFSEQLSFLTPCG